MRKRKAIGAVLMALAALMMAYAAYAVLIDLYSSDIDQLGGTGQVSVSCPVSGCQINRVKWELTSSYPYKVDKVVVKWQPASSSSEYTVCVTLFDNDEEEISGGCKTDVSGSGSIDTYVNVSPDADPAEVYKVQIVIFEE
jgi:hypothetical protein